MKNIALLLLCLGIGSAAAQEQQGQFYADPQALINQDSLSPELRIKRFVTDLNNPSIADDVILSKYVRISKSLDAEYLDYLLYSIAEIRLNIQNKDITQLSYIHFPALNRKDIRDIDLEGNNPADIYFIKYKDRLVLPILLDEQRIKSFTLVSNGSYAHFINY